MPLDDASDAIQRFAAMESAQGWRCSRITARFVVGGMIEGPAHLAWLADQGVTHVISAAAALDDGPLCEACELPFLHLRWQDDGMLKPAHDFLRALAWVMRADATALAQGQSLPCYYIHCAGGAFRSPLLATFLLAAQSGIGGDEAFAYLQARHPAARAWDVLAYRRACLAALEVVQPELE